MIYMFHHEVDLKVAMPCVACHCQHKFGNKKMEDWGHFTIQEDTEPPKLPVTLQWHHLMCETSLPR